MKIILEQTKQLTDSISILSELVNEVTLNFRQDGISLTAMDIANVAMVSFKISNKAFTEYELEEDVEIGININDLKTVLKRIKDNNLSLTIGDRLNLTSNGKQKKSFDLAILHKTKVKKIPELNFTSKIKIKSDVIKEAIEDVGIFSESVKLKIDNNKLFLSAKNKINSVDVELSEQINTDNSESEYSVDYLKRLLKGSTISKEVELNFGADYPLQLIYDTGDINLMFILAPRVTNN